jgi:hypothetical protein
MDFFETEQIEILGRTCVAARMSRYNTWVS